MQYYLQISGNPNLSIKHQNDKKGNHTQLYTAILIQAYSMPVSEGNSLACFTTLFLFYDSFTHIKNPTYFLLLFC